MTSIASLKASDGTGNASVATVSTTRSAGATTLLVDTVQDIPANFYGTMGTPHTFSDPVTGEDITIISEATAVDFKGHVDGSSLEIDTIAPGYTDAGSEVGDIIVIKPTTQWADALVDTLEVSHNDDGTLKVASGGAITDENGNEELGLEAEASAVNYPNLKASATGNAVELQATGDDTNIDLKGVPKGTGVASGFLGVKAGVIPVADLGSTGNVSVTGVGFKPRVVLLTLIPTTASTTSTSDGNGGFDDSSQFAYASAVNVGAGVCAREGSSTECIIAITASGSKNFSAEYVSLDSDGFTINVTSSTSAFDVAYVAYG